MKTQSIAALGAMLVLGCGTPSSEAPSTTPTAEATPESTASRDAGPIARDQVDARVAESSARMLESDGGRLVWDAIEAHGGLAGWLGAGTLSFDFDYAPLGDASKRRYTRNRVDLWSSRGVQKELGDGADATFGWNGEVSWITPGPDAFPSSARFWSMTPGCRSCSRTRARTSRCWRMWSTRGWPITS